MKAENLMKQLVTYFETVTEEQFLKDLELAGCLDSTVIIEKDIKINVSLDVNPVKQFEYIKRVDHIGHNLDIKA